MATNDSSRLKQQLDLLAGLNKVSPSTAQSTGYPAQASQVQVRQPAAGGNDLMLGAINAFGGVMRAVTSLGRGVVNAAGASLPYANQAFDTLENGWQAEDMPKLFEAAANSAWSGLGGFAKGFAYSWMPPTEESRQNLTKLFGGDVYEGAYELFKSEDFADAAKNIPALAEASSEKGVGWGIPDEWIGWDVPWLGIEKGKGMEFTKAGLYSFAFDVFTDPMSFLPLGLGGAVKGLKSGATLLSKGAKSTYAQLEKDFGKEVAVKAATPKELYPSLAGYTPEGVPLSHKSTMANVAYNAIDTNPLTFLGKEMARGVGSAWRDVSARSASRRIARVSRKSGENIWDQAAAQAIGKGIDPSTPGALYKEAESIVSELRTSLADRIKAKNLKGEAARKADAFINATEASARKALDDPEMQSRMIAQSKEYWDAAKADLPQGPTAEGYALHRFNAKAREIRGKELVISPKPSRKITAEAASNLGDNFVVAHSVPGAQVGPQWETFRADANVTQATKDGVVQAMFKPLESDQAGRLVTREARELSGLTEGDIVRTQPKATKGKAVKGAEQARPTEMADVIDAARIKLEDIVGKPLKDIKAADVTADVLESALGQNYRLFGERIKQFGLAATTQEGRLFGFWRRAKEAQYNPTLIEVSPASFKNYSPAQSGAGGRTMLVRDLTHAGSDHYIPEVAKLLRDAGVKNVHKMTFDQLRTKGLEMVEALTLLSVRRSQKIVTAEAYATRLGKLKLSDNIRGDIDSVSSEFSRIEALAEKLFPSYSKVTKADVENLAKALDDATDVHLTAVHKVERELSGSALKNLGSAKDDFKGIQELLVEPTDIGIPQSLVPQFVVLAYRASRAQGSIDGGRFADFVEEQLLRGVKAPRLDAQLEELLLARTTKWDGEHITAGLLTDIIRSVNKGGEKAIGIKNKKLAGFAERLVAKERESQIGTIAENKDIKLETEGGLVDISTAAKFESSQEWDIFKNWLLEQDIQTYRQMGLVTDSQAAFTGVNKSRVLAGVRAKIQSAKPEMPYLWAEGLKARGIPLGGVAKKYVTKAYNIALAAGKAGGKKRAAESLLDTMWPESLAKDGWHSFANKTSYEKTQMALVAEAMLARVTVKADVNSLALVQARTARTVSGTRQGLARESATFTKFVADTEKTLRSKGFRRPKASTEEMTLDEIIAANQPLALLDRIKNMPVRTQEDIAMWEYAIDSLLRVTVDGKKTLFSTGEEALEAFKAGSSDITTLQARDILAELGVSAAVKAVKADNNPARRTVLDWIKASSDKITQAEKEALQAADMQVLSGHLLPDTLNDVMLLSKRDRMDFLQKFQAQFEDLKAIAYEGGYGWLVDESIAALGPMMSRFFRNRGEAVKEITNRLFATRTAITPEAAYTEAMKESWELLSQYTTFANLLMRVQAHVAEKGFDNVDVAVQNLVVRGMRMQESYLLLRGIVPSSTPSTRIGAKEYIESFKLTKEVAEQYESMNYVPSFVTNGDILEIMPASLAKSLWFDGRIRSLPPTVIGEGARVLVAHMGMLKPGEWFTKDQYKAVYDHIRTNMIMHAKKAYTHSKPTKDSLNWLEQNGDLGIEKIDTYVRFLLSDMASEKLEAPAFRLFEKHRENALYSRIITEQTSPDGKVIGQLRETFEQMFDNSLLSKERKWDAIRTYSDELNKYLEIDNLGVDFAGSMAAHDAMVAMSSMLDRQTIIAMQESAAISAKAAAMQETGKKKYTNKAARTGEVKKAIHAEKKKQAIETLNAQTNLTLDLYLHKVLSSPDKTIGSSAHFDIFRDAKTEATNVNWFIRAADNIFEKMSWNYGRETLSPAIGNTMRYGQRSNNMFTHGAKRTLAKWEKQSSIDGVEYLTSSFEALKSAFAGTTREFRTEVLMDMNLARIGFGPAAQMEKLTAEAAADVAAAVKRIEKLFPGLDDARMNALMEVSSMLFRIFDEIADKKLDPQMINFYLRQAGELKLNEFLDEVPVGTPADEVKQMQDVLSGKTPEEKSVEASGVLFPENMDLDKLGDAWLEMDWTNHIRSLNSLNYAVRKTDEWYTLAGEATRLSGARKIETFKNAADMQAQGFVMLKGVDKLNLTGDLTGKELLYFMDTQNYAYPVQMIDEIRRTSEYLGGTYEKGLAKITQSKFFRRINKLQSFAKQMMTNMRPGNHLMNFMGGVVINDIAGLRNPMMYYHSLRLMKAMGISEESLGVSRGAANYWVERHFADLQRTSNIEITGVADPKRWQNSVPVAAVGDVAWEDLASIVMKKGGPVPWQGSMDLDLVYQAGAEPNLQAMKRKSSIVKAWDATSETVGSWAAHRDDFVRMALFLDQLSKNPAKNLEDAVDNALAYVNRYHPQPQDISKYNRDVTRHLILFYTWRAKTLGVLIGDLLDKPGRLLTWERAYYNYQAGQGYQPEYFGSHDPKDQPVRSYQQSTLGILVGANQYSISIAHPMWDLMGSDGWLSELKWSQEQSVGTNIGNAFLGTTQNVLYASAPLVENLFVNWLNGRTANGQDLMQGGLTDEEMPSFLQEVANSFGLNAVHATLAYFYPDQVQKANWKQLGADERSQELLRTWYNWATGARATKYLTPDNAAKAWGEYGTLMRTLAKRQVPGLQSGGQQAVSELLDYLGGLQSGTLGD